MDSALAINPVATVVTNSNGNVMNSIDDEIAAIEKVMHTKEYFKDEKKQARYRQLIEARERSKAKPWRKFDRYSLGYCI